MRRASVLAAAGALAAGGCGGSGTALRDLATFAPADATVFVAARTDDPRWRELARAALGRIPAVPHDAPEVAFAVVDGKVRVVSRPVTGSLAQTRAYREALAEVPANASAIAYAAGGVVAKRLVAFPGQVQVTTVPIRVRTVRRPHGFPGVAVLTYRWGVAWQTRDGGGARAKSAGPPLSTSVRARAAQELVPAYAPTLFDEIPVDALAVLDFPLGPGAFELLPQLPALVTRLFHGGRYDLPLELDGLLHGETAIYLRRGGELTVVSSPQDTRAAERALNELLAARNPPYDQLRVVHAAIGGQFVVSTSRRGIATFRAGGEKLAGKLELPEEVAAAAYVAPGAASALRRFGLPALQPLTAWTAPDGDDPTLTVRYGR